jgi:hypothetical protein
MRNQILGLLDNFIDDVLSRLDRCRFTPQGWAHHKLDTLHDARIARAELDPRWAEIQKLRGADGLVYIQEGLTLAHWEEQRRIERNLLPDPWWVPLVRRMSDLSFSQARRRAITLQQRARRGWSDADTWSLDTHLCATLSAQLNHLAANNHGWPGEQSAWPTSKDWEFDLRTQAELLERYVEDPFEIESTNRWYQVASDHNADPGLADTISQQNIVRQEQNLAGAKQALHWVADNLEHLWD